MKITELKITKSALFGEELIVSFSDKMTCIMGGRGTGKTTILTLLKWCFTDDTLFTKTELNLIRSNLASGTVEAIVEAPNNQKYTFVKSWGDETYIKDSSGALLSNIESIFPVKLIDYFSSGSIEQIGTEPAQRMKIIDTAIGSRIEDVNRHITVLRAEIDKNQSEIFYSREEYKKINQEIQILSNSEAQLKEAQEILAKNTSNEKEKEEFDAGLARQKSRQIEANELRNLASMTSNLLDATNKYTGILFANQEQLSEKQSSSNSKINDYDTELKNLIERIRTAIGASVFDINDYRVKLDTFTKGVLSQHQAEEFQFAEVRKKLESNRELYQKVTALTDAVTKLGILKTRLQVIVEKGKSLISARNNLLEALKVYYYEKTKLRVQLAESLNNAIGKEIKIAVMPMGDKTSFENYIREIISLAKMKVTNEYLLWELSSPTDFLLAINNGKLADLATQLNLSVERMEIIGKTISLHDKKWELETVVCDDLVNFYLKVDSTNGQSAYRPTEHLSLGQRCTTILPILFSVSEIPLVIDQPEDNLDNRFIAETIHQIIRAAKNRRQLVFVTHNPNIPVVADAEHNIFISYDNSKSSIIASGTVEDVKEYIVGLLEGGKEAFTQRKICYEL